MGLFNGRLPADVRQRESQRAMLRMEIDQLERQQRGEKNPREFERRRAQIKASKSDLRALG